MSGVQVKICGLTNLDDALAAADAGADYLGFNFYPSSPRFIDPVLCAQISEVMRQRYPGVKRVGVFVNAQLSQVRATLEQCQLDLAQLHGDEPPELLAALKGRAFKALRGISANQISAYLPYAPEAPAFLLDANVAGSFGGTGVAADWSAASQAAQSYPIFLAGGLKPENVAQAIERVRPWGVDTASGVEFAPGIKDRGKMESFINNVRNMGPA